MGLETSTYIVGLVTSNPDGNDQRSTADDHIRLIKAVLKRTFPLLDGAVSLSHTQLMRLNDLSASVQFQLNQLRDGSATANNAINSRFANSASFAANARSASFAANASHASSASFATLAATANSASFAALAATANSASFAAQASTASFAVLARTANSASFAVTCRSASSAALLSGLAPDDAATPNTIVQRNSSGYIYGQYFNQSSNTESASVGVVIVISGNDGFFRKVAVSHFGRYVSGQNITGRTGTQKTLSSSAPTGGSNGDIWYQY